MSSTPPPSPDTATLAVLLADLLPEQAESGLPAGDAGRFQAFVREHAGEASAQALLETLSSLAPEGYAALDAGGRQALIDTLRRKHMRRFAEFFTLAIQCYCLDPRVLERLVGSSRPPFPDGCTVPDGNLELLEAVYERGPCYRQC